MTVEEIIEYIVKTPYNSNPNVLRSMLDETIPDLSGITAGKAQILKGYKGVDKDGKEVVGTYEAPAEKYEEIKFCDVVTIGDIQSETVIYTHLDGIFSLDTTKEMELIYQTHLYTFAYQSQSGEWVERTDSSFVVYYDNSSSRWIMASGNTIPAGDVDTKQAVVIRQFVDSPPEA